MGSLPHPYVRDIPGFEGLYKISRTGIVWSCRNRGSSTRFAPWRRRKTKVRSKGRGNHLSVVLCKGGRTFDVLLHRLVLEVFVGPCPEGMECSHLDGKPANNHLENLRWTTHKENMRDMIRHGTTTAGEKNVWSRLTDAEAKGAELMMIGGYGKYEVAKFYGVKGPSMYYIAKGKRGGKFSVSDFQLSN